MCEFFEIILCSLVMCNFCCYAIIRTICLHSTLMMLFSLRLSRSKLLLVIFTKSIELSIYIYIYVEILPHCVLLLYLFFKVDWFFLDVFGVVNLALPFSVVVFYILYIKKCSLIFISHIEITVLLLTVQTFTVYLPACLKTYLLYVFKNCWML